MLKIYFDDKIPNHIEYIIDNFNFEMSSYENCDFVISCKFYAGTTNSPQNIQKLLDLYKLVNKKIIVFLICDFADNFEIPNNVFLFRTSIFNTKRKYNEYLLPYIWESFIDYPFLPLEVNKNNLPIVGFCGRVDKYRERLINLLQINNKIKCNFMLKTQYWGGNPHDPKLIKDFKNNIEMSHFTICNRGNGNYSMRFYQTLSLGRIPILVDTNLIFPFSDEINWHEIAIIGKNEEDVIQKIIEWWSTKDIVLIQKKCRETFEKYFNYKTFLQFIFNKFHSEKPNNLIKFNFPIDFDINIYGKYKDLQNLSINELIEHYNTIGKFEKRIYKLPDGFTPDKYRLKNRDLKNLNYEQLIKHYINNGIKESRKF